MHQPERSSETSHLVPPIATPKPSYINLGSNLCGLIFLGLITYCSFRNEFALFSFHPILMSIGWLLFMTTAINAITPGDLASEWMPIRLRSARHWIIQLLTGIIITIGFLVILSNKIINHSSHFESLHAKFGLASLIFMLITMLGGLCTLYSLKLKQYIAPIYTKLVHACVGLITFSLGVTTISLGFFTNWWSKGDFGDTLRYINLALVLAVMVFTILRPILKIFFRLKERIENIN